MSVLVLPRIDPGDRLHMVAPEGATLGEIVALAVPGAPPSYVRVAIGEHIVPREVWHRVRPKSGAPVTVRVLPGDSSALRAVLTVTVAIAAMTIGNLVAGPFGPIVGAVASTAVAIGGNMLINALIPRRAASDAQDRPTNSISGFQNQLTPGAAVPRLLGEMRWAPVYAARPYTEAVGNQRYIRALFLAGYGPLDLPLDQMRIGDTPISQYKGVTIEVREGYPGDAPVTIYPRQVIEEALSVRLMFNQAQVQVTPDDVVGSSLDVTFGQGLYAVNKSGTGQQVAFIIGFRLRYRMVGTVNWTTQTFTIQDKHTQPLTRTYSWTYPERGRYEVELTRTSLNFDELDQYEYAATSRSDWTALRSFRPEYPINLAKPLALIAVRIRATDQLNGMLDSFNILGRSVLPDWDGEAWVPRATRNPASHFRHVLTGNALAYPVAEDEMEALEDWHAFCAAKGLTYDRVHTDNRRLDEVLGDIAAAGRATPQDRGGRWGVVIDRILDVVCAHITPRNSWGFSGRRSLPVLPDAFRVPFNDRTHDYATAERVVPLPGFVGAPQVTEELPMPGITDPALIYREARRRGYELHHRLDSYEVYQDWEHLAVTRGDLVRLSHDVLDRTQVAARVKSVAGRRVVLDEVVTMDGALAYACRFRLSDGTSVLHAVRTAAGESRAITLTSAGPMPAVGDLAMFGLAAQETIECVVKGIEVGENLTARLMLVDHAPQVETLTDAEVAPAWSGRVGTEAGVSTTAPGAPVIASVLTGESLGVGAVFASVRPGPGSVVPASYEVSHRLAGDTAWAAVTVTGIAGTAALYGYADADVVEIRARAQSISSVPGEWCDVFTFVVGSTWPSIQDVATFTAAWSGSAWDYAWTLEDLEDGAGAPVGVKIRAGLGDGLGWDDLTDLHAGLLATSPQTLAVPNPADGIHTIGICAVTAGGAYGTPRLAVVAV